MELERNLEPERVLLRRRDSGRPLEEREGAKGGGRSGVLVRFMADLSGLPSGLPGVEALEDSRARGRGRPGWRCGVLGGICS